MMRRVRPDDYEPWLAELIASGKIDPPDEFVIEDSDICPACGYDVEKHLDYLDEERRS